MTQDRSPKLLPCPFCGSANINTENARDFLSCRGCNTEGPCRFGQGSESSAEAWNARAALDQQPAAGVGWISVDERLPESYEDVLIKRQDGSQRAARLNRAGFWELATYKEANRQQYMATDVVAWFTAPGATTPAAPDGRSAPVAWCELTKSGQIAYFDGKPMVMPGPVGNDCHTTPLYAGSAVAASPDVAKMVEEAKALVFDAGVAWFAAVDPQDVSRAEEKQRQAIKAIEAFGGRIARHEWDAKEYAARDANRLPNPCKGKNCGTQDARYHSAECFAEHEQCHAAATQAKTAAVPAPAQAVSEASDGLVAEFPHIALGYGQVEIGDATWEGLHALWFGCNGAEVGPIGSKRDRMNKAQDGETLALITFANLKGLEQVEDALSRVRRSMEAPTSPAVPDASIPAAEIDTAGERVQPIAASEPIRAALSNLVALKDMKNRLQNLHAMGHGTDYTHYHREQPLAWEAARAALATPQPVEVPKGSAGGEVAK